MDNFSKAITHFKVKKYDYQEKLSEKKYKRMEIRLTNDYVNADIERTTADIITLQNISDRLTKKLGVKYVVLFSVIFLLV